MSELGDFLRSRRAAVRPEDFGMPTGSARRRVPGLRREELALLAGISSDYYIRLEQGRTRNVSDAVLDAVADALQLGEDERTYLRNLARPAQGRRRAARPQRVRPGLLRLLESLHDVPAFVMGRRMDVLAWNALASVAVADFGALAPRDRNVAKHVFLFEGPDRYVEFEKIAKECVGHLRAYAGRHPGEPEMASLIGELSLGSEVFRRLWAGHTVQEKTHGTKLMRHPAVGEYTMAYETLPLPDDPDQALVTYTVAAGSESETSLRLLAGWTAGASRPAAPGRPAPAPATAPGQQPR
ncbi:helix-turn-helix transcriptional regulator [Streptomyces sp. DSM 44917]|uniref:Helix-turn-helix transcriptional regulator n=1 Tax=Streptomyces boetiae TaxID=3075541 RepID=A0ABU2L5Q6_9ACTN|nr:helix-turn-helix transcriptional regulator [Streptomyces sp. DSM 44917]MDT0306697.1 helix-turn-helix transcriptional regulator [Streptomyces sp. DSM 44917]